MSPVVIVSSFVPFQGGRTNPSQAVARHFAENVRLRRGHTVLEVTLEVLWDVDSSATRHEIETVRHRYPGRLVEWVAFGQGSGHTMETLARNRREPIADNAGGIPGTGPGQPGIFNDPNGSEQFLSDAADVHHILNGLEDRGVNILQSVDAGAFLCESLLYTLLQEQQHGHLHRGRFFHVPTTENLPPGDPRRLCIEAERHRFVEALAELIP